MTPTERRRRAAALSPEQRRETIVRAAVPLIAERGTTVTTAEVARAAGIAEGTIFRVFDDKNALIDACIAEALRSDQVLAEIAGIDLDQPLAARLIEAAEALTAHLDRIGALLGALHASGLPAERRAPRDGAALQQGVRSRTDAWADTRDALVDLFDPERDHLRVPPDKAADLLLGILFARGRGAPTGSVPVATAVDIVLNGALKPLPG